MEFDRRFFLDQLYPLQDRVLTVIDECGTDFYLTGGTALSRGYLNHRFSEDLDMFVNTATARGDDPRYRRWCNQIVAALSAVPDWQVEVSLQGQYYTRLFVIQGAVSLKVEFVDDVISHIGDITRHNVLKRIDSPENMLANKMTALRDRNEEKDLADVWGLCTRMGLSLEDAISGARTKSTGVYHPDIARRLCSVTLADWEAIRWINPPEPDQYLADLIRLGEGLIFGNSSQHTE